MNILVTNKIITQYVGTIWEENDGCEKQYICATYFFLLTIIDVGFNVIIDRSVGAPIHGKDVVSGLNAFEKKYI